MFGHDDDKDDKKPVGPPPTTDPEPDGVLDASSASSGAADDSQSSSPSPKQDDTPDSADDLIAIKQQALQQLTPLVGHLNQTPEEKFATTMMMIQASDDERLIKDAFEAAKQIENDKVRAQALLDIINEINYFTQPPENDN